MSVRCVPSKHAYLSVCCSLSGFVGPTQVCAEPGCIPFVQKARGGLRVLFRTLKRRLRPEVPRSDRSTASMCYYTRATCRLKRGCFRA